MVLWFPLPQMGQTEQNDSFSRSLSLQHLKTSTLSHSVWLQHVLSGHLSSSDGWHIWSHETCNIWRLATQITMDKKHGLMLESLSTFELKLKSKYIKMMMAVWLFVFLTSIAKSIWLLEFAYRRLTNASQINKGFISHVELQYNQDFQR